jgi:hypothetical protein
MLLSLDVLVKTKLMVASFLIYDINSAIVLVSFILICGADFLFVYRNLSPMSDVA